MSNISLKENEVPLGAVVEGYLPGFGKILATDGSPLKLYRVVILPMGAGFSTEPDDNNKMRFFIDFDPETRFFPVEVYSPEEVGLGKRHALFKEGNQISPLSVAKYDDGFYSTDSFPFVNKIPYGGNPAFTFKVGDVSKLTDEEISDKLLDLSSEIAAIEKEADPIKWQRRKNSFDVYLTAFQSRQESLLNMQVREFLKIAGLYLKKVELTADTELIPLVDKL